MEALKKIEKVTGYFSEIRTQLMPRFNHKAIWAMVVLQEVQR